MKNRPQRSKYGNVRTNGYASKDEANRAVSLRLLEKAGKISHLREQVKYELIPKQVGERACSYFADFQYQENGQLVVEECKGYRTPEYRIKRKLMFLVYGIRLLETSHGVNKSVTPVRRGL